MINELVPIYKKTGITPLQAIKIFKNKFPEYEEEKISYAGRLDPLAEGVMLLLVGDTNKAREKYLNLDKTYEFTVLFGASTDTGDILGKITKSSNISKTPSDISDNSVKQIIKALPGSHSWPYPSYSSKTVDGKPLWRWSREGRLDMITIPKNTFTVYSIKLEKVFTQSVDKLHHEIKERINQVEGDFRQSDILKEWEYYFSSLASCTSRTICTSALTLVSFTAHCSSGTYIRSISQYIGHKLNIPTLTYHIRRTKVGAYDSDESIAI